MPDMLVWQTRISILQNDEITFVVLPFERLHSSLVFDSSLFCQGRSQRPDEKTGRGSAVEGTELGSKSETKGFLTGNQREASRQKEGAQRKAKYCFIPWHEGGQTRANT